MRNVILTFGSIALVTLLLIQLTKWSLFYSSQSSEWLVVLFAVLFGGLGFFLSTKMKKVPVESETSPAITLNDPSSYGLSHREYEVLTKIAEGYSNHEIAEKLFISESTVKTHISNIYSKLDVKRRTQAISKAREWKIIA